MLTLELATPLRVAGEVVEGVVLLNFKEMQNTPLSEVRVKLRGSVFTFASPILSILSRTLTLCSFSYRRITRHIGDSTVTVKSKVELIKDTTLLWQNGSLYPLPGEDVIKLPFSFYLPSELLPSCEYKTMHKYGVVAYSVEVVGDRPGILQFRKKIMRPLPILPHSSAGATLRNALRIGWTGEMRTWRVEKKIRKGIWGDFSSVVMLVSSLSPYG